MGNIQGFYIHFDGSLMLGVNNKIKMQIQELQKHFKCEEVEITTPERSLSNRIAGLLPFCSIPWDYRKAKDTVKNADYIYIRRVNADFKLILFFKWLRDRFPQCKILMEVPTYPYDKQSFRHISDKPFELKDKIFRKCYKKYVDCIISMADETEIFGIPNIKIKNGINFGLIEPVDKAVDDESVDLLAVANFQPDHGYERVIKGMAEYYSAGGIRDIKLHMAGEGKEVLEYKKLVDSLKLNGRVIFHGKKTGEELEKLYSVADIGLGAFGCYKSGIKVSSVLKIREYLAKGLPVVSGMEEDLFQNYDYSYYLGYDNSSDNIDISKTIRLYDNIYDGTETKTNIRKRIREAGKELADISITYKPVVDYIKP